MKCLVFILAVGLLGTGCVFAEPREFTNAGGKTLKAWLVSVIGDMSVIKLASSKTANVPLKSLSADDQAYIDEFYYVGELKSYVKKDVSDITVVYTIYERVSTSDKAGAETKVEEISGEDLVKRLEVYGKATFETEIVRCEDSSQTGGNLPENTKEKQS